MGMEERQEGLLAAASSLTPQTAPRGSGLVGILMRAIWPFPLMFVRTGCVAVLLQASAGAMVLSLGDGQRRWLTLYHHLYAAAKL